MTTRPRIALSTAGIAVLAAALIACAPTPPTPAASPTSETTSPAPTPQATLAEPDVTADEIARAVFGATAGEGGIPETRIVASDALVEGERFVVEAACNGASVDYQVLRAAVGDSGTELVAGTVVCADGTPTSSSFDAQWSGPVQLRLTATDDVTQAWVVVRPEE